MTTIYKLRTDRTFPKSAPVGRPVMLFHNLGGLRTMDDQLEFEDVMTGETGKLPRAVHLEDFVPIATR